MTLTIQERPSLSQHPAEVPFRKGADGVYEITAADLFCGAGGTSTGLVEAVEDIEREYGIQVRLKIVAVNHWPVAIETHTANHRFAQHHCNSLKGVQPREVIDGPLDLLVASPECTHHSNARGGKPMDDQSRSSGDDVIRWIEALRPRMVIIENVREYRTWGPLNKLNRPIKNRKGEYFQRFLAAIRAPGYALEERLLCAADYGDPTTRIRLFVLCKLGAGPVAWPPRTHAKNPAAELTPGLLPWVAARAIIDWADRGVSIFNRKRWLKPNTLRRIEAGLYKFGGIDVRGWIVKLYGTSDVSSVDAPSPTVTGGGQHLGIAVPYVIRTDCSGGRTAGVRSIEQPAATVVGSGGLGLVDPKAFVVAAAHGVDDKTGNERRALSPDQPLPAVTGSNDLGAVQPQAFLLGQNYCEERPSQPRSVDEPAPTILAKGAVSLNQPVIVQYNGTSDARSVDEPAGTVTGKDRFGLVEPRPFLVANFNERDGQPPRTHSVDAPAPTVTHRGAGDLAIPEFITEYHKDSDGTPRVRPVSETLPTQDCANRFGLADPEAFMLSAGGPEVAPRSVEDPAHTVLTRDHIGVAKPTIIGAGGPSGSGQPQSVEDPLKTVIGENHKALIVPITHTAKAGEDPGARTRGMSEPAPTITGAHRGELALVQPDLLGLAPDLDGPRSVLSANLVYYRDERGGVDESGEYPVRRALLIEFADGARCLLDILFRMLRPRELARAQSFPDSYVFTGKNEDIVKQIGNAVPVKTAKALCRAALLQMEPIEGNR